MSERKDWVITIPHSVPWSVKEAEYKQAEQDPSITLNYKISYMPKCQPGDRLFVLWRKSVRGFHFIKDVLDDKEGFKCTTTGHQWPPGIYIRRHGKYHPIDPIKMTGFRGIRAFQYSDKDINMSSDIILSQGNRESGGNLMDSETETIVVDEHDDGKGKETEKNDSQNFDGITVIPWSKVSQFMAGKNGLTIVSPSAMKNFPISAKNSIQPGMTAEDGLFDLSELEGLLSSASTFEKALAEKDAKIAELEKKVSEHQEPEDDEEKKKKEEEKPPEEEEEELSAEDKAKAEKEAAEKKAEAESGESKTVGAEKDTVPGPAGKEEMEHQVDDEVKKLTFLLKKEKDDGNL